MDRSDKYFAVYKNLYELKGKKIRFNTTLGMYEGYIDYLMPLNRLVAFRNVYALPSKEFSGNLSFLLEDFISYEQIEPDEYEKYERWDYLTRILENSNFGPTKYKITDVFDDMESVISESEEPEIEEERFVLELPPNFEGKLPTESVVIDKIDPDFVSALQNISKQGVIGVSFAGPRISRIGELTWLSISIPQCTYLFDIQVLGKSAFDEGLRCILQDKQIKKVIHDCRKPSDCLYHQFGTKLQNVFDTQVADYIVNTQRRRSKAAFKYVSSLDCCLVNHLTVPDEFLINRKENYSYQAEVNFFRVRPVTNEYRAVLIKNVIYLRLLKEKLQEYMLNPFHKAVDIYLGVLADITGPQCLLEPHNPEEISPAVLMHGIQTVRYVEKVEVPPVPLVCNFKDPQNRMTIQCNEPSMEERKKDSSLIGKNQDKKVNKSNPIVKIEKTIEKNPLEKKDEQKIHKTVLDKNHDTVDSFSISYNRRRHIDDVFHKLVNSLHEPDIVKNSINVKPLTGTSTISIKRSFANTESEKSLENKQKVNCSSNYKLDQQNLDDHISEIASGVKTISVSHGNETLSKCHDTFEDTFEECNNSVLSSDKIVFLPAGMVFNK